jgi:tRNA (guanosine-2'-O-)-methyltransferase
MNLDLINKLYSCLSSAVTDERLALFNRVVENRTNYISVVLEDIFQPQNASAVLRSCDCTGIQNIHIIENRNKFQVDTEVAMGSSKWLSLHTYNNSANNSLQALQTLKEKGYRIVATTPHLNDVELPDFDLTKGKFALVFGTELKGITETVLKNADEYLKIPMFGFTESYNISVSAAIILYQLTERLRLSEKIDWKMTEYEKTETKIQWLRNSIRSSASIEKRFWQDLNAQI